MCTPLRSAAVTAVLSLVLAACVVAGDPGADTTTTTSVTSATSVASATSTPPVGGSPTAYIVVHADPGQATDEGFSDLVALRDELEARSATGAEYRVTIEFAPEWGDFILADPARTAEVAGWVAAGHELGFHHHTAGHVVPDGYAADPANRDPSRCVDPTDCSMEVAVAEVQAMITDPAIGGELRTASMGPLESAGVSYADDRTDDFAFATESYPAADGTRGWWGGDVANLLGSLRCVGSDELPALGEATLTAVPHMLYGEEKAIAVPLPAIEQALDARGLGSQTVSEVAGTAGC